MAMATCEYCGRESVEGDNLFAICDRPICRTLAGRATPDEEREAHRQVNQ